jgi:hypothetical protein
MTKLTESQIELILTAYPEILEKVLQDFLKVQIINKHFEKSELQKIIDLQIQEKILPTLQIKKIK